MTFNVLIIDDDRSFRKLLEKRLASFIPEMISTAFESLEQARKYLKEISNVYFDLVLVDQHLPDGNGADLVAEGWFSELAVISMSSDDAPEIPGMTMQAGATYFVNKRNISEPLFRPLVLGIIERNKLQRQLTRAKISSTILDTVKTMVGTLRHEIYNPLGAVLGAAYVMRNSQSATPEQIHAAGLVETSGQRIKQVVEQICQAFEMEPVMKANHKVFHIPGDKPWDDGGK